MTAKTPHLSDPSLAPFLSQSFDPADYLNSTLPPLTISAKSQSTSLSTLSTETQTLLANINAQATRLTTTLTQLTDDILRTGGRLAYQVDVLRGESAALSDSLNERRADDLAIFTSAKGRHVQAEVGADTITEQSMREQGGFALKLTESEPTHISQLRLLSHVRERLDTVIKVFGSAIEWPVPATSTSSFISVSAPTTNADVKAKAYAEKLRTELLDLIDANDEAAALAKVDEFRTLLGVWKGTAEERARDKFVSDLARLVDGRLREKGERMSPRSRDRQAMEDQQVYFTGMYT